MVVKNQKGFTLIEVVVVAGIIAILAGILVPLIFNQIDEAKKTRVTGDLKTLQTMLMTFRKDTGMWPMHSAAGVDDITTLVSYDTTFAPTDGTASWNFTKANPLNDYLRADVYNAYGTNWKGPYAIDVGKDPWDKGYVINVADLKATSTNKVWILSAGPNNTIDTKPTDADLCGGNVPCDDIGIRIK